MCEQWIMGGFEIIGACAGCEFRGNDVTVSTRREFLGWMAAGVMLARWDAAKSGYATGAVARVPKMLDHILLGCSDLERGIAFVEEQTGVKAAFGGVHPGRGTQNALLSLGERRYLEIIAPDPKQESKTDVIASYVAKLAEPRLVTWAAHPENIAALAQRLAKEKVAAAGPTPGSRERPDGKVLHWETVNLQNNLNGLLPFFIEWKADSVHPSVDAPKGCDLVSFIAVSPNPETLAMKYRQLGIEIGVERDEKDGLRARISGPKGAMELRG